MFDLLVVSEYHTCTQVDMLFQLTHCGLVMSYDDIDLGQHWPV